eukprot:gnl/Chilomastix_cuspidata/558.p1 GENE.gnl/Chilomastix_cuspidata/558~~gnl/Chilomastix_cuspidata/558.p1  ORF type:complete len:494 (-),score=141.98 gnl/Chilomastix_cuspidata/558:102-1475(-)
MTSDGIDLVLDLCGPAVIDGIVQLSIPDISFSSDSGGVSVKFELSNLLFVYCDLYDWWATFVQDEGISAGVDNGSIQIMFDWEYTLLSYPFSSGSGSGTITVDGVYVSATVGVYATDEKTTAIQMLSCSCTIGDFDLYIEAGSASSLINIFTQMLSPVLSDFVAEFVAEAIASGVEEYVNTGVSRTNYTITDNVVLDWHTMNNATFTNSLMANPLGGEYLLNGEESAEAAFSPPELPDQTGSHPFQFVVSFDTFHSAWGCYFDQGLFTNASSELHFPAEFGFDTLPFTVSAISELLPLASYYYSDSTVLTAEFELDYPTVLEPLYSGIYVELIADMRVCGPPLSSDDDELFCFFEGAVTLGLAEQPAVTTTTTVGLEFFFHNRTDVAVLNDGGAELPQNNAEEVFDLLLAFVIIPYLDDWGKIIAFPFFNFDMLTTTNASVIFDSSFVYLDFSVTLI